MINPWIKSNLASYSQSLLVLLTAGELHPRECALWDGRNEENCGTHPDSCHAGDGNQPPQPISWADPQTDRRWDPGEAIRRHLSEPERNCLQPVNNCGGHIHAKTNDVTWKTLSQCLIKCKSDVTHWEAMPKGGGNCFKQLVLQALIDTMLELGVWQQAN